MIGCLTNDRRLKTKNEDGGYEMKTASQIATENKFAANDLNLKSKRTNYAENKNKEKNEKIERENERKRKGDGLR